jgi:sugar phosphate permease
MEKIFFGWWIVLATSLIHFWGAGTFFYSFTAFFNPIVDEFGWSYAATSFAASLRSIEGGIASPLVGFAADRYGPRRLLFIGSILSGFGFIFLSQINSLWTFYLFFIFLSIGASLLFPVPGWTAVANWFDRQRGTAMGLLSASIGVGGLLIYVVNWLIEVYGWRTTLTISGIGMWVIGLPSCLIVRHRPEPYGYYPDGERSSHSPLSHPGRSTEGQTPYIEDFNVRQALKTRVFWIIALTATISSATVHAVIVHVMPYLISVDFSREVASIVASFLVLVSIPGRLGLGWLTNRIENRYLLAFGLLLQGLGLLLLGGVQTLWQAMFFIILFGPGYGGVITIRLTMQAEYFGRRAFGAIQGVTVAVTIIGTMTSPFLTGMYYDLYGNYRLTWLVMAALILASIPLALNAKPPQKRRKIEPLARLSLS